MDDVLVGELLLWLGITNSIFVIVMQYECLVNIVVDGKGNYC